MGTRFAKTVALECLQNSYVCHFSGSQVKSQRVVRALLPLMNGSIRYAPEGGITI